MGLFIFILLIGHVFYTLLHLRLRNGLDRLWPKFPPPRKVRKKVSVVIAIRNEEKVITNCLEALLHQDYPKTYTELILVDDRSEDETLGILQDFKKRYPKVIKIVQIKEDPPPGKSPKKFALTQAMEKAKGEIILSTDADCVPPTTWISAMVDEFDEDTAMVLGLTTFLPSKSLHAWLWGVQSMEFFSHTVISASLVANDFPINANANNMAYTRKVYDALGGFSSHQQIVSGDDDFLLQTVWEKKLGKVRFSMNPKGFMKTHPSESLGQIWEQRKRWASKCRYYPAKQVWLLSAIYGYYTLILLLVLAGLFIPPLFWFGLFNWAIKTVLDYRVISLGAIKFEQSALLKWFLPTAVIHIPLIVLAVIFGTFGKFTWKGQRVSANIPKT